MCRLIANVKKPGRAEVNYLPSYQVGEDENTLEQEREELVSELKKEQWKDDKGKDEQNICS